MNPGLSPLMKETNPTEVNLKSVFTQLWQNRLSQHEIGI